MSYIETRNPFTLEQTGHFELENFKSQQEKVDKLQSTQSKWRLESLETRIALVKNALEYFEINREEIANDISEQMGRPLHYANGEVSGFFERANYLCSIAQKTLAPDVLSDKEGFERSIEHCPYGVIFVIAAWNYPLLITVNSVIPALLAGNTVLLKHSSLTPKIGMHFEKAFHTLGEHKDLLINSVIDHATTGRIIEKLPINHVIFTGSVSGGQQILTHTSKKFMTPALELGGKDGAYVHNDADLDYAVASVVDGCMFNSGQSCCGIERAYVHADIYDEFISKANKLISEYQLGDPKEKTTTMGPLATHKAAILMKSQVDDAVKKGAQLLQGGDVQKILEATFFQPTLLTDVNHNMEVMKEENFGPILPVMKVTGVDQAIELINDSDYGLTCAVFTSDVAIAKRVAQIAETGTVFMNRCDYLDPAQPWTGVKNSGVGSSLSKYGFLSVTRRKSLHFKINI